MDEDEKKKFWEAFEEHQEEVKKKYLENVRRRDKLEELKNRYSEATEPPLEAIIYFRGVSAYQAEIWETRLTRVKLPDAVYTYWIWITDSEFSGRNIVDSVEDSAQSLDIIFKDGLHRDLKGFKYRHFAGNVFRIKFGLDIETDRILYQNLVI